MIPIQDLLVVARLITNEIKTGKEIYGIYGLDMRYDCEISGRLISGKRKACQVVDLWGAWTCCKSQKRQLSSRNL
jgi:hypothetical protein